MREKKGGTSEGKALIMDAPGWLWLCKIFSGGGSEGRDDSGWFSYGEIRRKKWMDVYKGRNVQWVRVSLESYRAAPQ